jgi:hypothetical protein
VLRELIAEFERHQWWNERASDENAARPFRDVA